MRKAFIRDALSLVLSVAVHKARPSLSLGLAKHRRLRMSRLKTYAQSSKLRMDGPCILEI
jgi:hypothetical protein